MTSFEIIYDAFLSKILEDEWVDWTLEDMKRDMRTLLNAAVARFRFPRVDLTFDEENQSFAGDLSNIEVQILATYMKTEWVNRTILTWENLKPLYEERDFSQANLLDKLNNALAAEQKNALNLERIYYRSVNFEPYDYRKLAGS